MTPEMKEKWLTALRSGDYKQGRHRLKRETEEGTCYCCLGVLADLIDPNAWEPDSYAGAIDFAWNGSCICLTEDVDLPEEEMNQLMHMNDKLQYSFNEIADAIEFGRIG